MLKVLIIDDEYFIRIGIKETINWSSYGFTICGEAQNGIEGYNKCMELRPDIVITDIKMKKSTGIELIERLNAEKQLECEIVILTAYDEFDYAKTALENGVSGYILKPINESELLSVMLKLKLKIEQRRQDESIIENLAPHIPYFKNLFLRDVLLGKIIDKEQIESKRAFYDLEFPESEYTVAEIKIDNVRAIQKDTDDLKKTLLDTIELCSGMPGGMKYTLCEINDSHVAFIVFGHDDNYKLLQSSFSNLTRFFLNINEQFNMLTGQTISMGYSSGYVGVENLHIAYEEARQALAYRKFVGHNSIVDYLVIPKKMNCALVIQSNDIDAIISAIHSNDKDTAFTILDKFFAGIQNSTDIDIESLKDVILELSIVLLRNSFKNIQEINEVYGRRLVPSNELRFFETVKDIKSWLYEIVNKMFDISVNIYYPQSWKVIDIIKKCYNNPLTVDQVADEIHVSAYYLMHFFKEETGKTFNQFLTEYRIEKAKELLKSGNYRIYEVSELVGYKNPTYFNYVFRKITGITPKKYSELHSVCDCL